MGKLNIKDLEYLVLEGGGAKGVVYLGAIEALEEQLEKAFKEGHLKKRVTVFEDGVMQSKILSQSEQNALQKDQENVLKNISGLFTSNSILDYYPIDFTSSIDKVDPPRIKGIAGSSAGAITSFALTLGLNSADITKVMEYSFTNFLKEKDIGKYRMVNSANQIKVGLDHKAILGGLEKDFTFKKNGYFSTGPRFWKMSIRQLIIGSFIESLIDGAFTKLRTIIQFFTQRNLRDSIGGSEGEEESGWVKTFRVLSFKFKDQSYFEKSGIANSLNKAFWFKGLLFLLPKVIFRKKINKPLTLDIDTIGNLIWDRGMFSGFSVREFFYEMMIFAATRDTHLQRGLIGAKDLDADEAKKLNNDFSSFTFGTRDKNSTLDNFPDKLSKIIQEMTFQKLYTITQIDFAVGVTNHSTGQPLIFSNKNTPDFLVMEAVAASMTIPPALKPLYNEGFVLKPDFFNFKNIEVKVNGTNVCIAQTFDKKSNTNFNLTYYQLSEAAVKKYLTEKNGSYFSTNNSINVMLPVLKQTIDVEIKKNSNTSLQELEINGSFISVDLNLLIYFYNICYMGLLVDGGALCNIPYNYFRKESISNKENEITDTLHGILALKLDGSVPLEMQIEFNAFLDTYVKKYGISKKAIKGIIKRNHFIERFKTRGNKQLMENIFNEGLDAKGVDELGKYRLDNRKFNFEMEKKVADMFLKKMESVKKKRYKHSKEIIKKLSLELTSKYVQDTHIPPWKRQKSILSLIGTLQYGAEDGQIRYLSDHNHIIPLYSYGVSTFDFDIEDFKELIQLSNIESKKAVNEFFAH